MRVNPRQVLLAALQGESLPAYVHGDDGQVPSLWRALLMSDVSKGRRGRKWLRVVDSESALLDRHLCHLTRSKQVRRMPDGRYAIRKGPFIWPGTRSLGIITVTVGEGEIRKGALVGIDPAGLAREYLETPCRVVIPAGTLRVGDVIKFGQS